METYLLIALGTIIYRCVEKSLLSRVFEVRGVSATEGLVDVGVRMGTVTEVYFALMSPAVWLSALASGAYSVCRFKLNGFDLQLPRGEQPPEFFILYKKLEAQCKAFGSLVGAVIYGLTWPISIPLSVCVMCSAVVYQKGER